MNEQARVMENERIDEEKMMEGTASEQCVVETEQKRKPTLEQARAKVTANLHEVKAIEEKMCGYDEWIQAAIRTYSLKRALIEEDLKRKQAALKRWTRQAMELEAESGKEGDA